MLFYSRLKYKKLIKFFFFYNISLTLDIKSIIIKNLYFFYFLLGRGSMANKPRDNCVSQLSLSLDSRVTRSSRSTHYIDSLHIQPPLQPCDNCVSQLSLSLNSRVTYTELSTFMTCALTLAQ